MTISIPLIPTVAIHSLLCSSVIVLASSCGIAHAASDHWNRSRILHSEPSLIASSPADTTLATLTTTGVEENAAPSPTPSIYHLYVAVTGADSNPGSKSAPFRTISKAAAMAKPSTTIHVAAGTYAGNVVSARAGTSSGRVRFVSDTKWGAKIVGTGTEAHWTNKGDFVDVSGFDISGPGRLGILNYASNTLIEGNHVHDLKVSGGCTGSGGAGIVDANYTATDADIIGNVVHDIGVPGKCNGVQGIYHSNLRGKIMNNIVYRVSAWGIHLWHAANNVVIANNTVFNNGSSNMGGGIEAGSGDIPGGIILNNTSIINNIVYDNPGASIAQYCYSGVSCIGSSNITANNLAYKNGRSISLRVGSAIGTVTADPKFINYQSNGSGNYRLQSASPAINKALTKAAPAYDIDSVSRPSGGAIDIGVYESF